jgi:hypothetical protein
MRNVFILIVAAVLSCSAATAQQLAGLWYSADSSRVYEIKELPGNTFAAVIRSSSRKTDLPGYTVIQNLVYNTRKKRYEGNIYAVNDSKPAFVKITFDKNDHRKIILKINRMLVMDVAINWTRVTT